MATDHDLINRLLTIAGTIMEDVSPVAIVSSDDMAVEARITAVLDAGRAISLLAGAADVVWRRGT